MEPQAFEQRYGFALDGFQRIAIENLYRGQSVLVAAPTGSGKTVIAEYALERAREAGEKSFYTTPLKALSNQKFRDLSRAYPQGDVGLLTGDNSINGDAPVVVMTTEVLRNMIYERSPLLERLGVVVLDEVHFMHDPFRGAVWEEIIIHLSSAVQLVGLSATVSNAAELGDWMNSLREGVQVVVSTERPVKLNDHYFVGHALVPLFSKNLQRIIGEQMEVLKKSQSAGHGRRGRGQGRGLSPRRVDVIRELDRQDMLPAIYFLFSRAACSDSVSIWLEEGKPLTDADESRKVAEYLDEKASFLAPADLECLDYKRFRAALTAGVAAHHAGVLPLFKEAIEELFTMGLLKVVFATETLSLGINMPARSVVIETLSKWGGDKHRPLTPGEYKQLTGRAGRRGIDEVGYAVVLYQKYFNPDHVRSLVRKEPNPVVSSFQVTYNMTVNLLAQHDLEEAQRLMNLSFAQYEADRRVVTLEARLESLKEEIERELDASRCVEGGDAREYRQLEKKLSRLSRKASGMTKERQRVEVSEALRGLKPGEVFLADRPRRAVAVVKKLAGRRDEPGILVVDAMGRYRRLSARSISGAPLVLGKVDINKVTSPNRKVRRSVGEKMEQLVRGARGGAGEPVASVEEKALREEGALVKEELGGHPCFDCQHRQRCLEAARRVERAERQVKSMKKERDSGHEVVSRHLKDVVEILNEFDFMEGEKLTPRGSILRRVYNECDLLLVEAMCEGALAQLEPRELAAAASWFIYESREGEGEKDRWAREDQEHLEGGLSDLLERLEIIEVDMKTAEDERELDLLGSLDTGYGEEAYAWAGGAELEAMLSRFPVRSVGDMVRMMKQIVDLLRQMAVVSPDPVLASNLREAIRLVDRGIVGYSSLESIIEHEGAG